MTKREPGLDLVRCVALLCVVVFHFFLYNYYYYQPQTGLSMVMAGGVRWLSTSCIGLFLMLTGYLQSTRTDIRRCWQGILPVLLGYVLAAAVSIPVRHFFLGEVRSLEEWGCVFLEFGGVSYGWYVEMYVGLALLMPFLNRAMSQFDDRMMLLFAGVLLAITALPGATPLILAPDHWRSIYPLTYYVLGAVVRRYSGRPAFTPPRKFAFQRPV